MPRILGIGITTLDIINTVAAYPTEDSEVRASSQRICRGGNATNTLVVLSHLGHQCVWCGTVANEPDAHHILKDLDRHGIDYSNCRTAAQGKVPTSYITLSQQQGTRTIVHYRDLPEYDFSSFTHVDLSGYDWFHFEGRNVDDTERMIRLARNRSPQTPLSVEIEKPRPTIAKLFPLADVLLFSRVYAQSTGFGDPGLFLKHIRSDIAAADLVCTWGDHGAYALGHGPNLLHCAAFPPPRVVDTLGAGDTFNAGFIDARLGGAALAEALTAACCLAGKKTGRLGFDLFS